VDDRLILFYNTLWGKPLDVQGGLPRGCEFTTDRRRYAGASAVVFHIPEWTFWWYPEWTRWRWLLLPKKLPGQLWVAWSAECEENYALLRDPRFMRRFDLTMTYRLDSDVPTTSLEFYGGNEYLAHALRQPPQPKLSEPMIAAFISSRLNRSGRRQYIRELARYLPIDSYGTFMRNKSLANDQGRSSKLEVIARYKFTLAFENACGQDYVTEKFFDPLVVGSVPVYFGGPNVEEFAPGEHCFINVADFPNPKMLAEYLMALGKDEAAYQAYFAWREKPYRAAFQHLLALNAQRAFVRLCGLICARLERG
jgi:hypothetical protein